MAKLNEYEQHLVDGIIDRLDEAYNIINACMHDLEGCRCKAQEKKLDTISGKLGNVMYDLTDKIRKS